MIIISCSHTGNERLNIDAKTKHWAASGTVNTSSTIHKTSSMHLNCLINIYNLFTSCTCWGSRSGAESELSREPSVTERKLWSEVRRWWMEGAAVGPRWAAVWQVRTKTDRMMCDDRKQMMELQRETSDGLWAEQTPDLCWSRPL